MRAEIFKRMFVGIGFSAINMFLFLTVFVILGKETVEVYTLWLSLCGSMVMGMYFGASSLIFDYDKWSPLKQVIVHLLLSITVFFPIAVFVGWYPLKLISLLAGLMFFLIIYSIFWLSFRYYFTRQAKAMNDSMKRK
ncbi:DUF3021 domain-containing protein [Paenibacillaceae bacterium]|nr:DUF3021 domain-containing protein [Paenibacillaceae bacterium]